MATPTARPWTPTEERLAGPVIKAMSVLNVWLFRLTGGRIGGRFLRGAPVCLVTVTGRKSGEPRTLPLIYLQHGDDVVVVASKGGMSTNPAWYHNMMANPLVEVEIASTRRRMRARQATDAERAALWPEVVRIYPDYDDYQARTTRRIPVVILSPA